MKKLLLILSIFFITNTIDTTVFAQNHPPRRNWERIDALRQEFVLKKLSLSPSEHEKFLPVYRTYQQEIRSVYMQRRKAREESKANPEAQVNRDFYFDDKLLEIKKQYKNKFQDILTPEQVKTLYSAEREFKEELLKQLRNH